MSEPSTGSSPSLRPATADDLWVIATLHRDELSYGLFPRLGRRFLSSYHKALLDSPESVSLVVCDERGLAGFLVGSFDHHRHQHWMLRRRGVRLALAGTVGLLLHPPALVLFARTRLRRYLRRLRRALGTSFTPSSQPITPLRLGVLLHVAVAPDRRGEGFGRLLTERFIADASDREVDELQLVTSDGAAAEFYRRLGWVQRDTRLDPDGSRVTTFAYELGASAPNTNDAASDGPPRDLPD